MDCWAGQVSLAAVPFMRAVHPSGYHFQHGIEAGNQIMIAWLCVDTKLIRNFAWFYSLLHATEYINQSTVAMPAPLCRLQTIYEHFYNACGRHAVTPLCVLGHHLSVDLNVGWCWNDLETKLRTWFSMPHKHNYSNSSWNLVFRWLHRNHTDRQKRQFPQWLFS